MAFGRVLSQTVANPDNSARPVHDDNKAAFNHVFIHRISLLPLYLSYTTLSSTTPLQLAFLLCLLLQSLEPYIKLL